MLESIHYNLVQKMKSHIGVHTSEQHFRTCAHGRTYPHVRMWGAEFLEFLMCGWGAVRNG